MKRSGFIKRYTPLKKSTTPLKRYKKLRVVGHSETADVKTEIQATLREIGLLRDGGCVLRHFSQAGPCGGRRKSDDALILQAEHLITRSNSATFADMRNIVILCRNHHGYWKPQHSSLYWELIEQHIGKERWEWMVRARDDHRPYKVDFKLALLALKQDLKTYQKGHMFLS